jgi:DNA-binding CsgD family transcriptional regulator
MKLSKKQVEQISRLYRLTPQQVEIVKIVLRGIETNREIAQELGTSFRTLNQHLNKIYIKFNIHSKHGLIIKILDSLNI